MEVVMDEKEKDRINFTDDPALVSEIENYFLDKRIKNFSDGYREIIRLGFTELKKQKGGK
jgi:hypothetical protein